MYYSCYDSICSLLRKNTSQVPGLQKCTIVIYYNNDDKMCSISQMMVDFDKYMYIYGGRGKKKRVIRWIQRCQVNWLGTT